MPPSFVPRGSQLSHPPQGVRPSAPALIPGCCPKDRPGPTPPLFLTVKMPPLDSATAALGPSLRGRDCSAGSTQVRPPPARRTDEQTQRAGLHSYFNRGRRRRARGDAGGPGGTRPGAERCILPAGPALGRRPGAAARYLLPSFFSSAFFCFCCMISESLRGARRGWRRGRHRRGAGAGSGAGEAGGAGPALTSACGRQPRARRPAACPCRSRSASSGSSAAPVRAGSRLPRRRRFSAAQPRLRAAGPPPHTPARPLPAGRVPLCRQITARPLIPAPPHFRVPKPPTTVIGPSPLPCLPSPPTHGSWRRSLPPPLRRHVPH